MSLSRKCLVFLMESLKSKHSSLEHSDKKQENTIMKYEK